MVSVVVLKHDDAPSDDDDASIDGNNFRKARRQRKTACILTVPETFISADSRNKQFYYPQMVSIGPFHYYQYNNRGVLEGLGHNATVAVAEETTAGAGNNNNNSQDEQVLKIAELLAIGDMERKGRLVRMEKDKFEAYTRFWNDDTRKDGRHRVKKLLSEDGKRKQIADHYDRDVLSLLTKTEFDEVIRHDAVFLLEFINQYVRGIPSHPATSKGSFRRRLSQQQLNEGNVGWEPAPINKNDKDKREPLFSKRSNNLVLYAILMDIMKLENQIPMMVLEMVTKAIDIMKKENEIPMMVLETVTEQATEAKELKPKLQNLLAELSLHVSPIRTIDKAPELLLEGHSKHLLDCFRQTMCMDVNDNHEKPPLNVRICIYKLLHLLAKMLHWLAKMFRKCRLGKVKKKAAEQTDGDGNGIVGGQGEEEEDDVEHRYLIGGAYKIQSAGITFVVMKKGGIKNIRFDPSRCVLWLPRVDVGIWTETLLRNLVAYEACECDNGDEVEEKPVSRFVLFMSQLLDSQRSAEVLKECGVLMDNLGDSERMVQMWNSMSMSRWIPECEVFDRATRDLNEHLSSTLVGYFFEFWELYLSRPWLILLVIVGAIAFTATILGVWNPFDKDKK